jgi:ParB family chromosome partitioning protein
MGRDRRRLYPLSGVRHPRVPCGRRAAQAQAGEARTEIASDGECCASHPGAGTMTTRRIDKIVLGERHRRDLGDIASLGANVAELGLLHPIVIRPDGLIDGERRLLAAKALGCTEIPVNVVDLDAVVKGEFAENAHRKDFTLSEGHQACASADRAGGSQGTTARPCRTAPGRNSGEADLRPGRITERKRHDD